MAGYESRLFVLGASHHSAPMALREKLYIDPDKLMLSLPALREQFAFSELVVLSTCNRFELIGIAETREPPSNNAVKCYLELQKLSGNLQKFASEDLLASLYFHADEEAVAHIYRVAASLDSLVIGETQITAQFKDAISLAQTTKTLGPVLTKLSQEALATAKKVRNQTAIGKKTVSISHAAIELASKVFGELGDHNFLVIGAGEMAQVAARYIKSYQPRSLLVANRTIERAQAITTELGFGEAHGLDELSRLLTHADIVLSSTAAAGYMIDATTMQRAMKARRGRPIILLDIALPRDIDPDCAALEDVYVFDIDDLQQVVDANLEERQRAAHEAKNLVNNAVEAFVAWRRTLAVKPTLAAFRSYLDQVIARESHKTLSRELFKDLNHRQREALETMFTAIAASISGDASRRVVNANTGHYPEQLADALKAIFALMAGTREPSADPSLPPPDGQAL